MTQLPDDRPPHGEPEPYEGYPAPPARHGFPTQQNRFATWIERVAAFFLDSLPGVAISMVASPIFGQPVWVTVDNADQLHFESDGRAIVANYGLGFLWIAFNWVYLQGKTGQTIGKMALSIACHRTGTTEPTGYGLAIGRYFARILDALPCYLGLLWPLWDNEKRTFSDMICGTRVYKIQ